MTIRRGLRILTVSLLGGVFLASCGSGDEQSKVEPLPHAVVVSADANCRQLLRDVKTLATGVLSRGYANTLELTTEGFAKPGIRVVKRTGLRQQELEGAASDPRFDLYADLFDPIVVLAEQRLEAGREQDLNRVVKLQEQLTGLELLQRKAARNAGLVDCDTNFLDAMVRSASE